MVIPLSNHHLAVIPNNLGTVQSLPSSPVLHLGHFVVYSPKMGNGTRQNQQRGILKDFYFKIQNIRKFRVKATLQAMPTPNGFKLIDCV